MEHFKVPNLGLMNYTLLAMLGAAGVLGALYFERTWGVRTTPIMTVSNLPISDYINGATDQSITSVSQLPAGWSYSLGYNSQEPGGVPSSVPPSPWAPSGYAIPGVP